MRPVRPLNLFSFVLSYCIICQILPTMIVLGQPSVPYDLGDWTYISNPIYPMKINASQIPRGANWTYVYSLEENHTYHVYCYGEWIDEGKESAKTDYDIYVYDSQGQLVSSHTEAAGLPEHLGTAIDQPFFTPQKTGNYSFLIRNDASDSEGAKEATLMAIEHIECNRLYRQNLQGKVNDKPVENTSWAYEFCTDSKHIEVRIEVPDSLDMYEARLYPMANPSRNIGSMLNGIPLAWEPGLYGELSQDYGGYNLNSTGFRKPEATASCEYPGQDMLINYTHPDDGNTLYHLVLIGEEGAGEISFRVKTDFGPRVRNPAHMDFISRPVSPMKIEESQIPIGEDWTYVYSLEKNHTYHVYCYGEWIDYDPFHNKTDYDIFVYNPLQEQVSYHTEAAGLPEHLGTTVDQPYFSPEHTGNYSFLIKNDPRESDGAEEATFMLIEHVECNKWHKSRLQGKINDRPVENTSRGYEFSTTSKHVEVWIEVPDTLDMYEARLYLMANPSKEIGVLLNDVPLAWEPGLYGDRSGIYGAYNLDSRGFRHLDATASCEYPGQDMLINYTSPDDGNILYHLVLIGEHGVGGLNFRVKTDFKAPVLNISNPPKTAFSNNETTIIAIAKDNESGLQRVLSNYTTTDGAKWSSIQMAPSQNQTYTGTIPGQPAGITVKYKVVASDIAENYAEVQGSYVVKNPTNLACSLSNSTLYFGEDITVRASISHGGAKVTLNYTCDEATECRLVSTDAYGESVDVYTPDMAGLWTVVATWSGNESCFGASSDHVNFTVVKCPMSVTCNISGQEITIGEIVAVTGRVEPVFEDMDVMLIFRSPNGSLTEEYVDIQSNGTFITNFKPDSTGSWRVQAQLRGDDLRYASSYSDLKTFIVNDTWIERYKFYMIGGAIALVAVAVVYVKKYRGS